MPKHRRQHPEVAPVWRRFFSLAPWHQQLAPGRAYTPTAAQREWCTHAMRLRLYYMLVGADGRVRRPAQPARRGRQVHLVPVRITRIAHALLQEWEPAAGQQTDPLAEAQQVLQSLVRWVEVEPPRFRRFAARCQPTARYAVVYLPAFGPRGRIPYLTPRARTQLELWVGRLAWRDYYWRATQPAGAGRGHAARCRLPRRSGCPLLHGPRVARNGRPAAARPRIGQRHQKLIAPRIFNRNACL